VRIETRVERNASKCQAITNSQIICMSCLGSRETDDEMLLRKEMEMELELELDELGAEDGS